MTSLKIRSRMLSKWFKAWLARGKNTWDSKSISIILHTEFKTNTHSILRMINWWNRLEIWLIQFQEILLFFHLKWILINKILPPITSRLLFSTLKKKFLKLKKIWCLRIFKKYYIWLKKILINWLKIMKRLSRIFLIKLSKNTLMHLKYHCNQMSLKIKQSINHRKFINILNHLFPLLILFSFKIWLKTGNGILKTLISSCLILIIHLNFKMIIWKNWPWLSREETIKDTKKLCSKCKKSLIATKSKCNSNYS